MIDDWGVSLPMKQTLLLWIVSFLCLTPVVSGGEVTPNKVTGAVKRAIPLLKAGSSGSADGTDLLYLP